MVGKRFKFRNALQPTELNLKPFGSPQMASPEYYRRQADLCMRLALMCENQAIAQLLLNKVLELRAEAGASESPVGTRPSNHRLARQAGHQHEAASGSNHARRFADGEATSASPE
jgi:hypothetical protein